MTGGGALDTRSRHVYVAVHTVFHEYSEIISTHHSLDGAQSAAIEFKRERAGKVESSQVFKWLTTGPHTWELTPVHSATAITVQRLVLEP